MAFTKEEEATGILRTRRERQSIGAEDIAQKECNGHRDSGSAGMQPRMGIEESAKQFIEKLLISRARQFRKELQDSERRKFVG